jgi:tRNA U54 and U55 pseudouridine synthase Pus10
MLGTGRPFYCEMVNPRRPLLSAEEYQLMEHEINAATGDVVQVRHIQSIAVYEKGVGPRKATNSLSLLILQGGYQTY